VSHSVDQERASLFLPEARVLLLMKEASRPLIPTGTMFEVLTEGRDRRKGAERNLLLHVSHGQNSQDGQNSWDGIT